MITLPRGISYRQFDHWVARGWIKAIDAGMGPGSRRDITIQEYNVLSIMGELVNAGVKPEQASEFARELHKNHTVRLGQFELRYAHD